MKKGSNPPPPGWGNRPPAPPPPPRVSEKYLDARSLDMGAVTNGFAARVTITKTADTNIDQIKRAMDAAIEGRSHAEWSGEPSVSIGRNTLWAARDALGFVRELAESDPVAETESGGYYTAFCVFCHEENRFHEPIKHADTCLWLRARKMTHG